ncbi:hypothetical protein [Geomonas edaphica]|uniref:hypothetical protein n=1 Tax=Geomonas edaphica TaxID=2570226 RepID=UPI001FEB1241|nr:hypothetical protein [Geomonas edaphica]
MTMHEDFLGNHSHSPAAQAFHRISISEQAAEVKAKLIHNVRRNSKRYGVLTSSHILTVIAQDLPANFHRPLLESISHDPLCSDIRTLSTQSGQLFFYSIAHMSIEDAATKGQLEEVKLAMAERIRRDSRIASALTPLNAMFALFPEITPVKVCAMLNEMQTQAHYRDIKTVSSTSGELYLYCDAHVTEKYASMLAKSAVSDACQTIVDTVREESRLYPRPTKVSAFTSQVYSIPPTTLQPCIVRVLNATEYEDIRKLVHPETEAEYLYSNLHMTEEQAVALMKWLEEGRQPST